MNLFDSLLKDMPKAAFRLNSGGTAYEDVTGNGNTLTGTLAFVSPLVSGNPKALSVNTVNMVSTSTTVFKRGGEAQPFSLEAWVLPTTFTGAVSILSHTGVYDGLSFDGNNIIFRIDYNTLPNAEITWPVPDFPEAVHVCATYSREKIQLYINRVLEAELELTDAHYTDGFVAEPSSLLYCGQSVSGTERLIVDGIAIFNKVSSRDNIANHFFAGRSIPTVADIVHQNGGGYFDGVSRDIALQRVWSSTEDWQTGVHSDVAFTAGTLVPLVDLITDLSLPGVWSGTLPLGAIDLATIHGVKMLWNGDGIFTVETSLDGITYTTRTNGALVPSTQGISPADTVLDIRITFTGGVALDVAAVRDLTLTVYSTNIVHGSDTSREIALTGAVSTALESNEPIERNSAAGLNFYGGYGILSPDLNANIMRINLMRNPSFEVNYTGWVNGGSGTTLSLGTDTGYSGTNYLHGVSTGAHVDLQANGLSISCSEGQVFTISGHVRASTPIDMEWDVQYLPSAAWSGGPPVSITESIGWQLISRTITIPAGQTSFIVDWWSPTTITAGIWVDLDAVLVEEGSTVGTYFDGDNGGLWTGTSSASASTLSIGQVRANLEPNPSFETTTMATAGAAGTKTLDPTVVYTGEFSTKFVWVSGSAGLKTSNIACTPLTTYTISMYIYSESGQAPYFVITAGDYGTNWQPMDQTVTAGSWQRVSRTYTTVAGQTTLMSYNTLSAASTYYVDAVLIERSATLGAYFDGNSGGTWTGTPNASISVDSADAPRSVAALEFWIKASNVNNVGSYVFDAATAYSGHLFLLYDLLSYSGHSVVYINGIATTTDTRTVLAGEWVHILYVPTTPFDIPVTVGSRYTLDNAFSGQIALLSTYPSAPTAAEALATYEAYSHPPQAQEIDSAGITIVEQSNAYTNYVLDWSVTGVSA